MRLTLLFICLFSILGGCAASSSHGVVVPKLVRYSEKQHLSVNTAASSQLAFLTADETGSFAVDDMEEDDDRGYLSLKKFHQANTAFAFAKLVSLSRLHNDGFPAIPVRANTGRKYITHGTLRV
jgi:hypothetical protein